MCERRTKIEEGDSLATEDEEKKGQNAGKAWKSEIPPPPFLLGEGGGFQGSEIVKCYFSSISFEPRRKPEKPRLQQFSNHPISKRILKWLSERSPPPPRPLPPPGCTVTPPGILLHCAAWIPAYLHGWNWKEVFLAACTFSSQIHFYAIYYNAE